jgi:hypothetical protein
MTRAPTGISSPARPSGVAAAVPALVAQAHQPGDRAQRRRVGEDALADQRVLAHDPPLDVVERAGLVEDVVGHRDVADVGHVAPQLRLALGQHLHQHVARLPPRGRPPRVLVRVHPLVGELQRGLRARGLGGIWTIP